MLNALFINITTTGNSPMYSQITSVTSVTFCDCSCDAKTRIISGLEQERIVLTDLCSRSQKSSLILVNDLSVLRYLTECCLQYGLLFECGNADLLCNHLNELDIDPEKIKADIPTVTGEFKHFYKDYKSYYYLPAEDVAYHKSVSEFVDKSARRQATARTAYTKKTGVFVPVFKGFDVNPDHIFRRSYEDKREYLPIECLDFSDEKILCSYIFCPHTAEDV